MSLLRPAIRACAVAALKDRTWCGQRVFDSDMTALAEAVYGTSPLPYCVVYTDNDDRPRVYGTELYEGDDRMLNVVLEIGVANAVQGTQNGYNLHFAATDQGMELAVDMVETQCTAALWGDPKSQWGEILKRLCWRITRVPSRRGGQAQGGVRFAARRITYVCNTLYDIPPGYVPPAGHPILDFISLAAGNPVFGITDVGTILQNMLSTTEAPDWRVAQAYLGVTTKTAKALQLPGVPVPDPHVEQPPLDWSDAANEYAPPLTESIVLADENPPNIPPWPPDDYWEFFT